MNDTQFYVTITVMAAMLAETAFFLVDFYGRQNWPAKYIIRENSGKMWFVLSASIVTALGALMTLIIQVANVEVMQIYASIFVSLVFGAGLPARIRIRKEKRLADKTKAKTEPRD